MNIVCHTENDLPAAARQLLAAFPDHKVFALYGPMGAGKTTFIKVLCRELGVTDIVQSPSFAIVNEYRTAAGDSIFHLDFYRIKRIDEVFDIGYEDYIFSGSRCFIEWPELIEELLPPGVVHLKITGENSRVIEF